MLTEHWSYFDALYFCFLSLTTIGYGDIVPKNTTSIIIFNHYIMLSVCVWTYLWSIISEGYYQRVLSKQEGMENQGKGVGRVVTPWRVNSMETITLTPQMIHEFMVEQEREKEEGEQQRKEERKGEEVWLCEELKSLVKELRQKRLTESMVEEEDQNVKVKELEERWRNEDIPRRIEKVLIYLVNAKNM